MNLTNLIEEYERGPWAALKYPDRASARARRVLSWLSEYPGGSGVDLDFFEPHRILAMQRNWGIKNSSMNRYIAVLDSMGFNVSYLPVDRDPKVRILSATQLARLDANVRADDDKDCQALYALMRDSGMRGLVEYARVEHNDFDWMERTLTLRSLKGRKGLGGYKVRVVPLSDVAYNALCWLRSDSTPEVTEAQWRAFWQRVRLDDTNVPYDLRHTFCTRLLDCNVPLSTVMRIMGHTNVAQTLYYQHQRPSALEAARVALQNE